MAAGHESVDGCGGCPSCVAREIVFVLSHGIAVEWYILFVGYFFHGAASWVRTAADTWA